MISVRRTQARVLVSLLAAGCSSDADVLFGPKGSAAETGDPASDPCTAEDQPPMAALERLDRGLIAVPLASGSGNYVGWRMLGSEYRRDAPQSVAYDLYRDGSFVTRVTESTNYVDDAGDMDSSYAVAAVLGGIECPPSAPVQPWEHEYLEIPLVPPPPGVTPAGESYDYDSGTAIPSSGSVGDGSPGDVDGDGVYELFVLWEPSNAHDNAHAGYTGPVYMDCYTLEGTRLWRIDFGPNIRAGAHYTQFVVYDFDGDGRAEVAVKTAPGTLDGTGASLGRGPAASDDDGADYRNADGYVLEGPEYLTVFEGATGRELATVPFEVARGDVASWGDAVGNRVDRFLASAAFHRTSAEAGVRPIILMARGHYDRTAITAWTWQGGELRQLWTIDSSDAEATALAGQGAFSMPVVDVDDDGAQEIVYGSATVNSDGSLRCTTGFGGGDALHAGDFVPSRPGLEVFMPHEATAQPWWSLRDAATCEVLFTAEATGRDNGRGVAADILESREGAEFWSAADPDLRNAETNEVLGPRPEAINFAIWWDADELRELLDGTTITRADGTTVFECGDCTANNHTKATPTLTADLFGDWREELVLRTPGSDALRIYTTTTPTTRRIYTLMHDPQYRMQVSGQMAGYNQPPTVGFFLGSGMEHPPAIGAR